MEIIYELFRSFGLVNKTNNKDRLFFDRDRSTVEITLKEILYSSEKLTLRVPINNMNAMLILAYFLTSRESCAKLKQISSTNDLLRIVLINEKGEAETEYHDRLMEAFIKLRTIQIKERNLQT